MMNHITGRFEFLHEANLAWLLEAETTGDPLTVHLLPGKPDWFLPGVESRRRLLSPFGFAQNIVALSSGKKINEDTIPKPGVRRVRKLLESFYQSHLYIDVFPDEKTFFHFRDTHGSLFQNKRIVSTNGCFDILHPGHLRVLSDAGRLGDIFIVAINADTSVRRFKGTGRPIHNAIFRGCLLARLPFIDYVVIFHDDTPLHFLRILQPSIHVKGGSFLEDRIETERNLLNQWNGKLVLFPLIKHYSTTALLNRYPSPPFPD